MDDHIVHQSSQLVGKYPTVLVKLNDVDVMCLIDTGSMVSTITEECFRNNFQSSGVELKQSTYLRITTSNGLDIPYIGYLEVDVCCKGVRLPNIGFLVVKDS